MKMRVWSTTLLVLIALGGAGLAAAADRPHNALSRPELTWRADQRAEPWIDVLAHELALVEVRAAGLSRHGRDVLGRINALDVERMNEALAAGDLVFVELQPAIGRLLNVRDSGLAAVEEWRLGPPTRSRFDQLGSAVESAQTVVGSWQAIGTDARRVAGLIDSLLRHDGLVFRATTAGRAANWDDALALLEQAKGPLGEAAEIRDVLATGLNTDTLDDLLDRYRAYDASLTAMYSYIRDTGRREGREFKALEAEVGRAQAALPADTSAMSVIVAEAAGPPLTDALVAIERARGDILDALAVAESDQP